jgi:hypothetical protein
MPVSAVTEVLVPLRSRGVDIRLVVFDYLNTMASAAHEREKRHELVQVSRDMVRFAKTHDVVVWSAALVNRAATDKAIITKSDIAEAFEVIAVCDGIVALCGSKAMRAAGARALFLTALRHEGDDKMAGYYAVDFKTMRLRAASAALIAQLHGQSPAHT